MYAMIKARRKPEDFISPYYLTKTFKKTWAHLINPIPDKSFWLQTEYDDIMPPPYRRKADRPKKTRRRGEEESNASTVRVRREIKCRKCKQPRHNARTCRVRLVNLLSLLKA